MLRPEVVRRRLQKADEYLKILEELRRYTLNELPSDTVVPNAFCN